MARTWAKAFYRSSRWLRCRDGYIAERRRIDGGMCEVCHERLGHIVHHKTVLTAENINDPDMALNHRLLSYECKDCHDRHEGHGVNKRVCPLLEFDRNGDPIPPPKKRGDPQRIGPCPEFERMHGSRA